jgi:hypothetical protein
MTRKSRRELEKALKELSESLSENSADAGDRILVWEDPDTGEWFDDPDLPEGPLGKDSTDPLCVITETVVETGYNE